MYEAVSHSDWKETVKADHFVQFYETDDFLLNSLTDFIGAGLDEGDVCVVIARKTYRETLEKLLNAKGHKFDKETAKSFVLLDAEESLSTFLAEGQPDIKLFKDFVEGIIAPFVEKQRRVRIFGEMVALLWEEKKYDAAICLEELWSDLHKTHSFSLFCAYPIKSFSESHIKSFNDVCAKHTRVIPSESYTTQANANDRPYDVTDSQQKAKFLQTEVEDRKHVEEYNSHLAAIIESSDDAIISKTLDGIILSWNRAAERIFGYSAEEVIGKPILILIPPDRVDEETLILGHLRRGERIDHYETIRRRKDGRLIDVSLTVSPVKDSDGKVLAISKIARDITERKRAEAELREQAEIIETINRVGQMLSAELNMQNVVQIVTDATTELTGAKFGAFFYNVIDQDGESYMLYTLSGVPKEAFEHFPMPRNTELFGPTFRGEGVIRIANVRKDPRYGKNSPYYGMPPNHLPVTSYLAVPVISVSGEVLGGLFFGHPSEDVFTERHERIIKGLAAQASIAMDNARLYQMSQQEKAKAENANRMKDEFLATVSHELRTPLNAIIGWSHMVRSNRLDKATIERAIETIERNAKAQAQLIEDILDVSRVITGKLCLNITQVDISSVINAAIDSVLPAAESKGIKIGVAQDSSARHITGDANRLQQVIWNLLSNAIKFTPKGGRVEVRLEREDSEVKICVNDTGQGIHAEFLPFIFDPFRQADSTSTRKHGGLGLGLSIVRHLVELHGGSVQAESPGEGCGATFTISLPFTSIEQMKKQRRSTGRLLSNEDIRANLKPLPSLEGIQVLLVDDDKDTLQMLTVMLTEYGAEVQTASSVAEALETLEWYYPNVLVSDLAMPDEDGYSLINKVRMLDERNGGDIPAIALTAYARVEDRAHALSAGFNMFVPKPVKPNELITVIANLADIETV